MRLCFVALEAPFLFALRVTMPDLAADPARRSRLLASLLPMTAPAFLVTAERAFPNGGLDVDAMVYGLAVGATSEEGYIPLNKRPQLGRWRAP